MKNRYVGCKYYMEKRLHRHYIIHLQRLDFLYEPRQPWLQVMIEGDERQQAVAIARIERIVLLFWLLRKRGLCSRGAGI